MLLLSPASKRMTACSRCSRVRVGGLDVMFAPGVLVLV